MTLPHCSGLSCDRKVSSVGAFCSSCWPMEPKSIEQIHEEVLRAAYVLRFGNTSEREAALETLSHLLFVLQHSTHNPNKET